MQDLIYYRSHKILLCLEIYSASLTTIYAVIYIHTQTTAAAWLVMMMTTMIIWFSSSH